VKNHIEYTINRKTKSSKQKIVGNFISDSKFKIDSYYSSDGTLFERTNAYINGELIKKNRTKTIVEFGVKLNPFYGIIFITFFCISIVCIQNPQFLKHGIIALILGLVQLPYGIYLKGNTSKKFRNIINSFEE